MNLNPDKARRIDFWVGVPLCFLLTIVHRVLKAACFKKRRAGLVKKIVFVKLPELGAIILAYPLLLKVKNEYPSAELFFVTFNRNKGVVKLDL